LQGQRRLDAFEGRSLLFQFLVQRQAPGNTAHRCRPYTKAFNGGVGGLSQAWVVGQAKIIIGAEIFKTRLPSTVIQAPWALSTVRV